MTKTTVKPLRKGLILFNWSDDLNSRVGRFWVLSICRLFAFSQVEQRGNKMKILVLVQKPRVFEIGNCKGFFEIGNCKGFFEIGNCKGFFKPKSKTFAFSHIVPMGTANNLQMHEIT